MARGIDTTRQPSPKNCGLCVPSLIDGTYELFRHFFAIPSAKDTNGREVGAVRGVLASVLSMIKSGTTHLGVATDHVVESFRNDLYPGYKTSEGVPPELLSQFPILEEALESMGVKVWPMIEFEADDALAAAAAKAAQDARVTQIFICTPDKDLSQCVVGTRVVQLDRRQNIVRDEAGVIAKFGVPPAAPPASADGAPKPPPQSCPAIPTSKTSPKTGKPGRRPFAAPARSPNPYSPHGTTPSSSALWPPSA